jgi:uncharacterized protein YjbI with pentapeptide repeats
MPRKVIVQPLPIDIRNESFRGQDCEGWDFSGRDIRGCDFTDSKLNGANFKLVVAGRSKRQVITDLLINGSIAAIVGSAISFVVAGAFTFAGTFLGAVIVLIAVSATILVAGAGKSECKISGLGSFIGAVSGAFIGTGLTVEKLFRVGRITEGYFLFFLALCSLSVALIMIYKAIHQIMNTTGTSFKGAKMRDVDFSYALLNNCDFNDTETAYVNWYHVQGKRSTISFDDPRMQILISRKANNSMCLNLDLKDLDLTKAELVKTNLSGADLTRSNLQNADFTLANLANVKAGDTNFGNATFTGACIQNWTINTGTKFDKLVCEHIFLTPDRNPQNRRPLSGSFESGDFELLVDKFADTLDFVLRRGTDLVAFKQALSQLQQDNPTVQTKAVINLDADRLLVQVTVPENSDKVKIYEEFHAKLQLKDQEISYLKGTIDDKTRMIDWLLNQPAPTIQLLQANNPTGDLMSDKRTQTQANGDIISAGDGNQGVVGKDLQGVAGRDISGTLNLSLTALSETSDPKDKELIALITQVRDAIEAPDSELDDRYKKRALEYLTNLTNLAKDKPKDLLKTAKENLDDLTDIAEKGSNLATFAEKYLPTFSAAIDGLRLLFGI